MAPGSLFHGWRAGMGMGTVLLVSMLWPSATDAQSQEANRITRIEIDKHPQLQDAFEVIRTLRPIFLHTRGSTSANGARQEPDVYLDDVRMRTTDALTTIPASNIEDIRYLSATEAGPRYGRIHGGGALQGVILVRTRRQVRPNPRSLEPL